MTLILLHQLFLFIAPQLWIEPFVGLPVDYVLYPIWLGYCGATGKFSQIFKFDAQDKFFIWMVVLLIFSMVISGWGDTSSKIAQNYVKWFLLYRLVIVTLNDASRVRKMALMLLFFAAILSVEGVQHFHSPNKLGWAGQTFGWVDESAASMGLDKRTRWINIFDGPGVFCVVYTIALPYALFQTGKPFGWPMRVVSLALVLLLLLGIYYTGSRGGYLTTIAILGLFVAVKRGISLKRLIAGGVLGALILILAPGYVTSTSDSHKSAQHRVDMWIKGVEMAQMNPLLGIGKGNFLKWSGRLIAHNSAIEIMGETGFLGLFLWIGIIYMGLKKITLFRQSSEDQMARAYAGATALSIIGYLISAMFVTLEYETFYILLAMSAVFGRNLPKPAAFSRSDLLYVLAGLIIFFISLKIFVMIY